MSSNITETKICVQKMLPHHKRELDSIQESGHSHQHVKRLSAAFFTKKIWPKGSKIKIAFMGTDKQVTRTDMSGMKNIDPLQKEVADLTVQQAIKKIVRERIQPLVNLDISFVDKPEQANVRISFDSNGGAWSLVGTDHLHERTEATMNLGWFDVPTTIHEFGHMLGMIHEHQNPHGEKIKWNEAKVYAWAKTTQGWSEETTRTNIIQPYETSTINGSNFDPLSIMLYFFPGSLTTNDKGTHQNLRYSGEDVLWIHNIYPSDSKITPDKFYKETYNQNIQTSIELSKKEAARFESGGGISMSPKTMAIYISIFIVILLIIAIWWNYKKRKSGRRYGYGKY